MSGGPPPPPRPRRRLPSTPPNPYDCDEQESSPSPPTSNKSKRGSIRREGPLPPVPTPKESSPSSSSNVRAIPSPRMTSSSPPESNKFSQAAGPQSASKPAQRPTKQLTTSPPPGVSPAAAIAAVTGRGGGSSIGGSSIGGSSIGGSSIGGSSIGGSSIGGSSIGGSSIGGSSIGGMGGDDEREKERNNVAREIFETEKKYVDSLDEMINCYQKPLLVACDDPNNHLKKGEIMMMFSNVEVIYNLNKNILDQLKSRLDNWSSTQKMGDVFRQFAPYLKMYTAYGQGYQPALDAYNLMMKENPKFSEFLNQYRGGKSLTLEHLLIMPVQRVPRYNLLLSDLLRKTDKSHPDYQNIDLAIKAVEEAAVHMNQTMRKAEQMNRLVQNASAEAFGGLLEASRSLLMDGVFTCDIYSDFPNCVSVTKQDLFAGGGKKTDKYHLFCFNDILVYIKQSEVKRTKDLSKTTTNMHFNLVWVEDKGEALMIRCPNRRIVVHFPSSAPKSKWLNEITDCIFRSLVPYPTGGTPTKSATSPTPPPLRYGEYMWGDGLDITYKGWWLQSTMHQEGLFCCNGNQYEGSFISGLKSGTGRLIYNNGFIYEGEFSKDFPNGEGKLTSPAKEVYRGKFKDGRMNGHGSLEWPNGDKCTGDWENNRVCGRAKLVTKSGISYEGQVQDNLPHGNGTVTMGSLCYMGNFEYGERHGAGMMDYGNGIKYEGNWEDDKYIGKGVLMNTQDGSRFEGEFLNGRKCGAGGMKYGNGDRYEGQWKNDAPHGKGEMVYRNKDVYIGNWKSGKYHGTGVLTYSNGLKVEGKWVMGQLEGNTKVTPGSNLWNVSKTGIPSVALGDFAMNVEPLPELPKRLQFSFC